MICSCSLMVCIKWAYQYGWPTGNIQGSYFGCWSLIRYTVKIFFEESSLGKNKSDHWKCFHWRFNYNIIGENSRKVPKQKNASSHIFLRGSFVGKIVYSVKDQAAHTTMGSFVRPAHCLVIEPIAFCELMVVILFHKFTIITKVSLPLTAFPAFFSGVVCPSHLPCGRPPHHLPPAGRSDHLPQVPPSTQVSLPGHH